MRRPGYCPLLRLAPARLHMLASLFVCYEGCSNNLCALATKLPFPPSLFQAAASLPLGVARASAR